MASRWARFSRGWVVAVFSLVVAGTLHVAGGGNTPGVLGVVIALVFAGVVSVGLAGATLSLIRLTVSVALSQAAFHLFLSLGTGSAAVLVDEASGHHSSVGFAVAPLAAGGHSAAHGAAAMLVAHAIAALITIAVLYRAESAFWSVLTLATHHYVRVLFGAIANTPPLRVAGHTRLILTRLVPLRTLDVLYSGMRHRGPPRPATGF